jgi:Phosphate uptake regulator
MIYNSRKKFILPHNYIQLMADVNRWFRRRLQKITHGSYIVSLPAEWIQKEGLRPHDEVNIIASDGVIYVFTMRKPEKVNINLDEIPISIIKYIILAYYMQGGDEIFIYSRRPISAEVKRNIRETIKSLRGASISDVTLSSLTIKMEDDVAYLNKKLFEEKIENKFKYLVNIFTDLERSIVDNDKEVMEELLERTADFDTEYRYLIRLISKMAQYPQYNIFESPRELIAYASLIKDMSRSVYHTNKLIKICHTSDKINIKIKELSQYISSIYSNVYNLYKTQDLKFAEEIKQHYLTVKSRLEEPKDLSEYEIRRICAYGVALMDDILNLFLVPRKIKTLNLINNAG